MSFKRGIDPRQAMGTGKYSITPTKVRCKKNQYNITYKKLAFKKNDIYTFVDSGLLLSTPPFNKVYTVFDVYGQSRMFPPTAFSEFFEIIYK